MDEQWQTVNGDPPQNVMDAVAQKLADLNNGNVPVVVYVAVFQQVLMGATAFRLAVSTTTNNVMVPHLITASDELVEDGNQFVNVQILV